MGWVLIHQLFYYWVFALLLLWTAPVIVLAFPGVSGPSFSWPLVTYHPLALEFIGGCFLGLLVLNGQRPGGGWALGTGVGFWIVLSLYLSHVLVLSAMGRCWAVLFIPGPRLNWLVFFFMLIVVLLWGFLSTRFLEQPLQEYAGQVKVKGFSGSRP